MAFNIRVESITIRLDTSQSNARLMGPELEQKIAIVPSGIE